MSKVALITGASRGIGMQIAITFAEAGYDIAVNYRDQNEDTKPVEREVKARNVKFLAVEGDVSKFEDTEKF